MTPKKSDYIEKDSPLWNLEIPDIHLKKGQNYLGNPNLKKAYVQLPFTQDHKAEYRRCAKDPVYFVNKYMKIVHVDKGLVPFNTWDFQEEMLRSYHENRFSVSVLARQMGKSVTTAGYILHFILFHNQKDVGIIANKGSTAAEILSRIKLAYEWLPKWMQQGVVEWNKNSIELENGCRVFASATTGSSIRGKSLALIFIDEVAFIPENIFEDFWESTYPVVSSGQESKVIMVSTPNGRNHFFDIVEKAKAKLSEFVYLSFPWWHRPDRDDEWARIQIANTSQEAFDQEFGCEFKGGTKTLLKNRVLESFIKKQCIEKSEDGCTKIYEHPQDGHIYMGIVDVSKGLSQDHSTIQILDISEPMYRQVASYRSNEISPLMFPAEIYNLCGKYNKAFTLIELNDVGYSVAKDLFYDLEYENMIMIRPEKGTEYKLGLQVDKRTKRLGCLRLRDMTDSRMLEIVDPETINELFRFSESGNSYAAEEGSHDDLVMPLVNFAYFSGTNQFEGLTDSNFRKSFREKMEMVIENDLPSCPVIDDGTDMGWFDEAGYEESGFTYTP